MSHLNDVQSDNGDDVIDGVMESFMVSWMLENVDISHEEVAEWKHKPLALSICVGEEDDFPHPRYLCFKYPFGKTPFKKHCKKCYCYVCEEVAPCKKWNRSTKKHCQATEDKSWKSEKIARKKTPSLNITMVHHTLSVSFMHHPPEQTVLTSGFAGGMISDINGNWVTGFSMRVHDNLGTIDSSVPPYIALTEGLKLAWSRGFRFLDVELGYLYHEGFWEDFKKDTSTGKYSIRRDEAALNCRPRVWPTLREVEGLINQNWFVNVKNSKSIKEESGALALAMLANRLPRKQVYDFPSHVLTSMIKLMAKDCKDIMGSIYEASVMPRVPGDPFKDLKLYLQTN